MKCPGCGHNSSEHAVTCPTCGAHLPGHSSVTPRAEVRRSRLGLSSFILGLLAVPPFFIVLAADTSTRRGLHGVGAFSAACLVAFGLSAILLGIIAVIHIATSGGRVAGAAFPCFGIAAPVFLFSLFHTHVLLKIPRSEAFGMLCGTNLSGIGKAVLIYANDYEDELPRAGGRSSTWAPGIAAWNAATRSEAYGLKQDGSGGQASITSCFYLLTKYTEVTPKSFLCGGDKRATEFNPADYGAGDRELIDLWDFGPNPVVHCSYSMHLPFDKYALTTSSDPGMAVAADRNPFQPGPFKPPKMLRRFSPDDRRSIRAGNAYQHHHEGQNVLFLDAHVGWEPTPLCGINNDNIWTHWDGGDIRMGAVPAVSQQIDVKAKRRQDSVLVTDGPGDLTTSSPGAAR